MSASVVAQINLGALRRNLGQVRHFAPGRQIFAAIKADAYGHGALPVAQALAPLIDGFAVARLDEALQLRWGGVIGPPIMLLSDPLAAADLAALVEQNLQPLVFEPAQLERLLAYRGAPLTIWLKLDSGMHRLGFPVEQASALHARLQQAPNLKLAGWVTHLACADDPDSDMTERQVSCFDAALASLPGVRSIANSAGITAWPCTHADLVRPGIMLYGGAPLLNRTAASLSLEPVMTLTAPVLSVHRLAAGETVGYGATWKAETAVSVAVAGIGYGDGYPRHAGSGTPALINGQRCQLAGRVSMDMITLRLPEGLAVRAADEVQLWGEGLPADEVAASAGTIAYELFCRLTPRVSFRYVDDESPSA